MYGDIMIDVHAIILSFYEFFIFVISSPSPTFFISPIKGHIFEHKHHKLWLKIAIGIQPLKSD